MQLSIISVLRDTQRKRKKTQTAEYRMMVSSSVLYSLNWYCILLSIARTMFYEANASEITTKKYNNNRHIHSIQCIIHVLIQLNIEIVPLDHIKHHVYICEFQYTHFQLYFAFSTQIECERKSNAIARKKLRVVFWKLNKHFTNFSWPLHKILCRPMFVPKIPYICFYWRFVKEISIWIQFDHRICIHTQTQTNTKKIQLA